ncbi:Kelch domain-containing protein 2 [Desmophyllum pertusum]|uniref:Kelch domain-containing protein 2 n=1 Tax=Desmophyllum pertusum TaxID=174260 RepID=A0A9W9Z589_9CNID|nr:Kelch domain-containing protein 2 [Desmophyllum pertusum]
MTFVFPSTNGTVKPRERSGHVAVHFDGYLVVWGGYYNGDFPEEHVPGFHLVVDRNHPSNEVWFYCIETSAWKHIETSGDTPPPLSGSSACVIGSNILKRIKGNPPSDRDKLCCWTYNDLILYFGGYGIAPDPEKVDESCGYFTFNTSGEEQFTDNRGWNSHLFVLDTSNLTWSQPKNKG